MSGQFQAFELINNYIYLGIPLAIITASIIGSTHCVLMCSPIALIVKKNNYSFILYNLGRLISYLTLGLAAGFLGNKIIHSDHSNLSILFLILISLIYIFIGIRLIFNIPIHFSYLKNFNNHLFKPLSLFSNKNIKSLFIGIANGFIPCGWLYIFVLGSITTKNPIYGAIFMFLFWLGTLPALSFLPLINSKINLKLHPLINRNIIAGVILIFLGLTNTILNNGIIEVAESVPFQHLCGKISNY